MALSAKAGKPRVLRQQQTVLLVGTTHAQQSLDSQVSWNVREQPDVTFLRFEDIYWRAVVCSCAASAVSMQRKAASTDTWRFVLVVSGYNCCPIKASIDDGRSHSLCFQF